MAEERIEPGEKPRQGQIDIYDATRLQAELDSLLPDLTDVTTNALGKTPNDMREVVSSFNLLIAVREQGKIVGYAGYDIEDVSGVGKILNESKMVRRDIQGRGYGTQLTQEALALHPEADYLTFSSQNPSQIESARKALGGTQLAPIDINYQDSEELREVLRKIAVQTGRTDIDLTTGVRKSIYFGERFGDYTIDLSKPSIAFIEQQLAATGFERDAGDGVFFIAKLKSPKQSLDYFLNTQNINETNTQAITGNEIVRTVMNEVGSAENSIVMTMDMAEELGSPLPVAYHELLGTRLREGVQITRVGFGTPQDAEQIAQTRTFDSPYFTFLQNDNATDYQRMILVDGNTLFFRYNGVFYRSTDGDIIEHFKQYFREIAQESQAVEISTHQPERRRTKLMKTLRRLWPL